MSEQTPEPDVPPTPQAPQAPQAPQDAAAAAEGKRNLAQAVQREVAGGYRVESQTDINAVLVKGKGTNHVLHLIITLVTCGLWGLVWIAMYFIAKERRIILSVDDYGNVLRQDA